MCMQKRAGVDAYGPQQLQEHLVQAQHWCSPKPRRGHARASVTVCLLHHGHAWYICLLCGAEGSLHACIQQPRVQEDCLLQKQYRQTPKPCFQHMNVQYFYCTMKMHMLACLVGMAERAYMAAPSCHSFRGALHKDDILAIGAMA